MCQVFPLTYSKVQSIHHSNNQFHIILKKYKINQHIFRTNIVQVPVYGTHGRSYGMVETMVQDFDTVVYESMTLIEYVHLSHSIHWI